MPRYHAALGSVALLALVVSCGAGCAAESGEDADASEDAITASDANAALEIHALDIWARALDAKDLKLSVTRDGHPVRIKAQQTTTVFLKAAGTYALHLESPQHQPLDLSVNYDGKDTTIDSKDGGGYALAHTHKDVAGRKLPAHILNLGLKHKWFSSEGRPSRDGNAVQFMMDGEEAWGTVAKELHKSTKEVLVSTWWWQSDFELTRAPIGASEETRWSDTILGLLEAIPSEKKVLVGEFIGQDTLFSLLNTDSKLRAHAANTGDHFEMMSQANETRGRFKFEIPSFPFGDRVKKAQPDALPFAINGKVTSSVPPHDVDLTQVPFGLDLPAASFHQKFMVVDHDVAFVGGMNLKAEDWDTSKHEVYDVKRMALGAFDATRNLVAGKHRHPDTGPRKDYMLRIEGPSAQDVADVFHERWEHLREIHATHSEVTTPFTVGRDIAPRNGGMEVQVTATLPSPFKEHAIAETWFNAVNNAVKYIYIEDQYFRMPMINDAIAKRMTAFPELKLIVITKPVGTNAPECLQTFRQAAFFASRFGGRFLSMQLRAFDGDNREFADMDVHSKMLIVDDVFMSVGSANKNNRGMVYEAELNVAVVDASVGAWRKRIISNLIGGDASDDAATWFSQLQQLARTNDDSVRNKGATAPRGFVYGLAFGAESACLMQSIGPDAT
jgi:hypothetical protein